ncbi:NUP210 [Lepeophtheirus salmonis]|uniref:NUP210 n=1 Tax=Lepeophtheirus salmonis TaxID=72036 RepID=A0A7R8CW51_LEPSM|nr:NUP210 [Lepeophtheirus salmonis]CAF2949340.1 NUP210 [Lepeophtheirus salmonis]
MKVSLNNCKVLCLWILVNTVGQSVGYQQEFYLPYSETEDVDFTISRNDGCFQWSTEAVEVVNLRPLTLDYSKQCGNVLEFVVIAKAAHPEKETIIKIFAENVNENIDPVRLEILGLKTILKIRDPPSPFGVSAYDAEDNEFDTLDGLQIRWFIGSERDVLVFNSTTNNHDSTTYVVATALGKATLIVLLEDPNYNQVIKPATLEVDVKSPFKVEPDGVFVLPGGEVEFKLFEEVVSDHGSKIRDIDVTGDNPLFTFEIEDSSIASIDKETSLVTALKEEEDETMIMVKNREGEVIKQVPFRITIADSLTIKAHPGGDQVQLLQEEEYEIKVEIFDKYKRRIYPSKNILCKTSYPGQFKVVELSDNGLWARIHTKEMGRGRVKAHLRSVLTSDDEEIEVVPHLRGNVDFEIYEAIKLNPKETILPWDETVKPEYSLNYKASGGSKLFRYSVSDEEMATSTGNGQILTHGVKSGSFKVRASMAHNENIFGESEVYIVSPETLSIDFHSNEGHSGVLLRIPIVMTTSIPDADDRMVFNDCTDIPFKLTMSQEEHFKFEEKDIRGSHRFGSSCANIYISCSKPGAVSDVTVSYRNPTSGQELIMKRNSISTNMFLAIGSSSKVIIDHGPLPWYKDPSTFFRQIEIEDPDILKVNRINKENDYEKNVYDVTCKAEGKTNFIVTIGNKGSESNNMPAKESREVTINCVIPRKISLTPRTIDGSKVDLIVNPSSGKILLDKEKGIRVFVVVKDGQGHTLESVESLKFSIELSDSQLIKTKSETFHFPKSDSTNLIIPSRPYIDILSQKKKGNVDIEVSLVGYDEDVFKSRGLELPDPFPIDEEENEEEEDFAIYSDIIGLSLLTEKEIISFRP